MSLDSDQLHGLTIDQKHRSQHQTEKADRNTKFHRPLDIQFKSLDNVATHQSPESSHWDHDEA